ncbi:MAG: type II toxin-antitoxin system RelB/DinJ family antitoxin [Oscillospiraceae bacterium]|nr:type II toxin-antitoxin system RelB/DinJ family antitoxin [Oscillospiraceae bacterium]
MAQTSLNVNMDEETKKGLEKFCFDIGLNVTIAVNMFAKSVVREQRLPFDIYSNTPNQETVAAINDVKSRKNLSRSFSSVEELMEDLNADN